MSAITDSVHKELQQAPMQHIRIQIGGPGGGPGRNGPPGVIARVLWSIAAVVMLLTAAFLGAIFFLAALGFFMVGMVVLVIRVWWVRRKLERAMRHGDGPVGRGPGSGRREEILEGEYRVVGERRDERGADRERGGER
jgi:hypothetical protein